MKDKENIATAEHMVGGNLALVSIFYNGKGSPDWTGKDIKVEQDEAIKYLKKYVENNQKRRNIKELVIVLKELEKSDWSDKKSFYAFEKYFMDAVRPTPETTQEIMDSLFKRNVK